MANENVSHIDKILNFVEENKTFYLKWLADNEPAFPTCCYTAAEILCSYFRAKYGVGTLVISEKLRSNRINTSHAFVVVEGHVIDFTYFQHKIRKRKYSEFDEMSLAKYCFGLQSSPVLKESTILEFEPKYHFENPRFIELTKTSNNFKDFLKHVLKSEIFINYSIYDLIPYDKAFWRC